MKEGHDEIEIFKSFLGRFLWEKLLMENKPLISILLPDFFLKK